MHSTTGPTQKSGPYLFDIRSLAIWKAKTQKKEHRDLQRIRVSCQKRDLTKMVSHAGPDATETLCHILRVEFWWTPIIPNL